MKGYKRLFIPLLQEKLLLIVSICSGVLAAAMNLSRPLLMGLIVDRLIQKHMEEVYIYIALFVGSRLITWGNSLLFDYVGSKGSQRILRKQRIALLRHFLSLSFEESEKVKQGELETLVISDIPNWARLYGAVLAECIHATSQFIGAIIAFHHIDIQFIWYVIPFLIVSVVVPMFMSKKVRTVAGIAQKNHSSVVEAVSQFVKGVQDLRSLREEEWAVKQFKKVTNHSYKAEMKKNMMQSFIGVTEAALESGAYMTVLIVGAQKVMNGELEIGALVAILATIEMLFFPVRYASDLVMMIQVSVASASRVWSFLDIPIEIGVEKRGMGIELIDISFKNPQEEKNIIENVHLQIKPGEFIAIVGESGAGKTTLLKLIVGLYKPTNGRIEHYGNEGRMTSAWQESRLFRTTVKENIIFQRDVTDEELETNMKLVNADTIIDNLSNGINTIVKNDGECFSGGELKRLALWRAIVSTPNIVILDEPTAGLDPNNQEIVWDMIKGLGRNVTRIVTTHDIKSALIADRIVVMRKGSIAEYGAPKELLSRNSLLKEILAK